MSWLFQPIPAAGQQQAGGATPQPEGWYRPFEKAPLSVIIPVALVASGLVWCPQPIAASPSNTVTIDKWQQPLSKPVPVARAIQGDSFVPFNTTQIVSTTPNGWHSPLSVAANVARPVHTQPLFVPAAFPQYPLGWHQPLSKPVPAAIAQPGNAFVPFNTAQTNTATIDKWLQPLSIAVPVTKAQQGDGFVPLNTAQINTTTIDKWQQPLVAAVKLTGPAHTQPSFVVPPFEVPRGWYQQLSTPAPVGKARFADQQFPFYPATVDNNVTLDKWQQPLSVAVPVAKALQGDTFVPFNTVQPVAGFVSYSSYQQPLSVVPATFKAQPGYSDVPFNTAQINTVTVDKWLQPLSVAPLVAKALHTQASFVALPFPQYPLAWQQPLSQAVKSTSAVPTQPTFVTVSVDVPKGWYQALSQAPLVAKAQFADQPLQFAPSVAADNNVTLDKWQQPLSVPAQVAKAQQGSSFVPFSTAQAQPSGIAGMAWFVPLGIAVPNVTAAPPGFSFVPFDTVQVTPPVEPVIEPPAGGGAGYISRTQITGKVRDLYRQRRFFTAPTETTSQEVFPQEAVHSKLVEPEFAESAKQEFAALKPLSSLDPKTSGAVTQSAVAELTEEEQRRRDDEEAIALLLLS